MKEDLELNELVTGAENEDVLKLEPTFFMDDLLMVLMKKSRLVRSSGYLLVNISSSCELKHSFSPYTSSTFFDRSSL